MITALINKYILHICIPNKLFFQIKSDKIWRLHWAHIYRIVPTSVCVWTVFTLFFSIRYLIFVVVNIGQTMYKKTMKSAAVRNIFVMKHICPLCFRCGETKSKIHPTLCIQGNSRTNIHRFGIKKCVYVCLLFLPLWI